MEMLKLQHLTLRLPFISFSNFSSKEYTEPLSTMLHPIPLQHIEQILHKISSKKVTLIKSKKVLANEESNGR